MPKWLSISIGVSLLALLLSITTISWLAYVEFRKMEPEVLSLMRDTHTGINTTFDNLNRDCSKGKDRCGTLANVNETLHTIRGTAGQIEVSLHSFNSNQSILLNQEQNLYAHADGILSKTGSSIDKLGDVINGFSPLQTKFLGLEDQASTELTTFHQTNSDVNRYLESKTLKETFDHLYGVSEHLDSMSGDISAKTHEFLYPAPCVGKTCWLKRTYTVIRDVGPLAEPFYYETATFDILRGNSLNGKQF